MEGIVDKQNLKPVNGVFEGDTEFEGNADMYLQTDSKHGKAWSPEEDHKLLELVNIHGSRKSAWPIIANAIGGRTAKTCRIRWWRFILPSLETHGHLEHEEGTNVETSKKNRVWSKEEEDKLYEAVKRHGVGNWRKVAAELPGRTASACDLHWYLVVSKNLNSVKSDDGSIILGENGQEEAIGGMKRKKWSQEDDALLKRLVLQHGAHQCSWPVIANTMGRTEMACRWRYTKHLHASQPTVSPSNNYGHDIVVSNFPEGMHLLHAENNDTNVSAGDGMNTGYPSKRRRWTVEEDERLRNLVENRGTDSWAVVANKLMTGRSGDACQYHWQYELYPKLLLQQQSQAIEEGEAAGPGAMSMPAEGGGGLLAMYNQGNDVSSQAPAVMTVAPHTYSSNTRSNEWYKWTAVEDQRLRDLIDSYGYSGQATWEKIASQMPGRTLNSCRMRWKQALRPTITAQLQASGVVPPSNAYGTSANEILVNLAAAHHSLLLHPNQVTTGNVAQSTLEEYDRVV